MDKFSIDVRLCIVSNDPTKFLVKENAEGIYEFPVQSLTRDTTSKKIAANLLYSLTGITENWTAILSFGESEASMSEENIILLYACFPPEPTRVSEEKYCWVDYHKLKAKSSPLTLSLAHEVAYKKV